jgi:hypothetical protein
MDSGKALWGWCSWLLALVLLAFGVVVGYRMSRAMPGVTQANYDRVEQGMTADQVRALLGPETGRQDAASSPPGCVWLRWRAGDVTVSIAFSRDPQNPQEVGVVMGKASESTGHGQ